MACPFSHYIQFNPLIILLAANSSTATDSNMKSAIVAILIGDNCKKDYLVEKLWEREK